MAQKIKHQLIQKALNGDAGAFGEIYLTLRGSIYGFAYRMLRETSLAEDVTQEAFMFLLNNPHRFDSERGELLPFLCGVARIKIVQHLRKHSTKFEFYEEDLTKFDELDSFARNPLEILLNEELSEKIEKIIDNLPPVQREVLILREIENLTYAEIAEITDTELGQVKIRLHRARKSLANELRPIFGGWKRKEL
ncbi:MAG: RNA polymerase sigma factor [Blastocatellia bacterium]|nr:RNA polymerase sigma factor [Blastocatellia bacterium]